MNLLCTRSIVVGIGAMIVGGGVANAQSNIDPAKKFCWGENIGWMNWYDADGGNAGVIVHEDHLSGFVWCENAGWVNVGPGSGPYANDLGDSSTLGVNVLPSGDLDGLAWGENIGWLNFGWADMADPNRPRFDAGAGRFRGWVWGENVGWINLDDGDHFVGVIACDIDCIFGDITTTAAGDCVPQCTGAGGDVNFDDVLCALEGFANPANCPCADIKGPPGPDTCAPNGVIDFDDVLTILNAFAGNYDCPDPCGAPPAPIMDPPGRDSAVRDAPAVIEPAG